MRDEQCSLGALLKIGRLMLTAAGQANERKCDS